MSKIRKKSLVVPHHLVQTLTSAPCLQAQSKFLLCDRLKFTPLQKNRQKLFSLNIDSGGHAVEGVDLRPLACRDCGFESRRGLGNLSVVSVVCFQVEVSATARSLVQRSPTECSVCECGHEASIIGRPWLTGGCCAVGN